MPLTFSHPAASLPFRRLGLPLSPLVLGAMLPDFAKFFTLSPANSFGHTWPGIFWFCVPVGLVCLWLFHRLLKQPLALLLPLSHHRRLAPYLGPFAFFPAERFTRICAALALGACTHLAWDSCTHRTGLVVTQFPSLQAVAFRFYTRPIPVYNLLQHLSTVLGFLVLVFSYVRWYRGARPGTIALRWPLRTSHQLLIWITVIIIIGLVAAFYGRRCSGHIYNFQTLRIFAGHAVVAFGGLAIAGTFVYCLWFHLRTGRFGADNARRMQ